MTKTPNNPWRLGQTAASGEQEHLLGGDKQFVDLNYASTDSVKPLLSQMTITAMWVKNKHSSAVTPGLCVLWSTDSTYGPYKATGAGAGATGSPAGIVDPYLPAAGVAANKHYWLIRIGPCKMQYDGSANIAIGDVLKLAASGTIAEFTVGTTAECYFAGRALAAISSGTAGTLFRAFAQFNF